MRNLIRFIAEFIEITLRETAPGLVPYIEYVMLCLKLGTVIFIKGETADGTKVLAELEDYTRDQLCSIQLIIPSTVYHL